ncbi:MAG: hypothetical protein MAG431_02329 [Chloroflexi bacterium]|nr:hypothetical protein [Chloroflexota bacterium]
MRILKSIRERIGMVVGAGIGAVALVGFGLLLILVLAPKQKLQAWRIERMPIMGAGDVATAPAGEEILVTGRLAGEPLPEADRFVAYELESWVVTPADPATPDAEPDGEWETVRHMIPDLALLVDGENVQLLRADDAKLSGPVHEKLVPVRGEETAEFAGDQLPEGSLRYSGLWDGDLVTVLGKKASAGGLIPDEYYAGDRVAFGEDTFTISLVSDE